MHRDADFQWPEEFIEPMIEVEGGGDRQTPSEIIGPMNYIELFKRHFRIAKKLQPDEFEKKISKSFSEEERAIMSDIYKALRNNGWIPSYMDEHGRVVFGAITTSRQQG